MCDNYFQLVTPNCQLEPGKIYDSNTSMLLASLDERGFPASSLGIAKDDRESLVDHLRSALNECDVLITSGGVSMGEKVMIVIIIILPCSRKISRGPIFTVFAGILL
jgi:molybdenum cofactor synthesis domain-containing protein